MTVRKQAREDTAKLELKLLLKDGQDLPVLARESAPSPCLVDRATPTPDELVARALERMRALPPLPPPRKSHSSTKIQLRQHGDP